MKARFFSAVLAAMMLATASVGITASAEKLRDALSAAYAAAEQVTFENVHYRRDIGQRALAAKK